MQFKEVRGLLRTVGLNAVAFGLIIAVQQILVFPALSRMVDIKAFSSTILLVTLSTVVVNVVGGEASNVALLRSGVYRKSDLPWDSARILVSGLVVFVLSSVIATVVLGLGPTIVVQYIAITALGVVRTYGVTPDKAIDRFGRVVVVHAAYVLGAIIGLLFVPSVGSPYLPFLVGEVISVSVVALMRKRHRVVKLALVKTREYKTTLMIFIQIAVVALLMNLVSYLDRLVVIPLLGAAALSVYYAASALSKSLIMLTNPVANALLSRLGSVEDERSAALFARASVISLVSLGGFGMLSYALSLIGLKFLYPAFFESAIPIVLPVAVAAGAACASDLLRPLIMRFVPTSRFLVFNIAYACIFVASVAGFSASWGLPGFAWASALARGILFAVYFAQSCLAAK